MKILAIILGLLYALFPFDLFPDMIAGLGWLDDAIIVAIIVRYLYRQGAARQQQGPSGGESEGSGQRPEQPRPLKSPHEILGLPPGASKSEIKHAYRTLVAQYHPDKVSHLGPEFIELAEKRFKEIQQAYDELIQR